MNCHEGKSDTDWLVLYQTRDANAGDPILSRDFKVQVGSDAIDADRSAVHLFNEKGAVNMTAKIYTGIPDDANGTYVFFKRGASVTGSVLTNGLYAIIGGGALLVGLAGGYFLAKGTKKKHEEAVA